MRGFVCGMLGRFVVEWDGLNHAWTRRRGWFVRAVWDRIARTTSWLASGMGLAYQGHIDVPAFLDRTAKCKGLCIYFFFVCKCTELFRLAL